MKDREAAHDDDDLDDAARELLLREPIFHRPEWGTARGDFEAMMAPGFREVGASGNAYSRDYVLDVLEQRSSAPSVDEWRITEFRCECIAPAHYLATYLLEQSDRLSRRATLWRCMPEGWQIVYHQGTLVAP